MDAFICLVLFFLLIQPLLERGMLSAARVQIITRLEAKRGSKVIALVHRQEKVRLLGMPLIQYIDMEDSESIMLAIRQINSATPIDVIIHSPGGEITAAEQISAALLRHPARVTVFVPHYAMSGAALIALAGNELVMNPHAVLGVPAPHIGEFPADSILNVVSRKSVSEVEDKTWIMAENARKACDQIRAKMYAILSHRMEKDIAERLAEALTSGEWTRDYPISVEELLELGLPVSTEIPVEVYQMMNLYPQPKTRRPSVDFIPIPYWRRSRHS